MNDLTVKVDKNELRKVIEENRTNHRQVFEEAVEGYRKKVTADLEAHVDRLKKNKIYRVSLSYPVPEDHTADYDRVLRMLEMHQSDVIDIAQDDFASYVMDDWGWKDQFVGTTSQYR